MERRIIEEWVLDEEEEEEEEGEENWGIGVHSGLLLLLLVLLVLLLLLMLWEDEEDPRRGRRWGKVGERGASRTGSSCCWDSMSTSSLLAVFVPLSNENVGFVLCWL